MARKHYFQTTDDHFARAASDDSKAKQNPKPLAAVLGRGDSQPKLAHTENAGRSEAPRYCAKRKVVREGFEAVSLTANADNSLQQSPILGEAESEAVSTNSVPIDADLAAIVEAWPTLPEPIKAGILAMIRAAK